MNILVTGANGFIGKNLITQLHNDSLGNILEYDSESDSEQLKEYCLHADFIFHLAGVNRPTEQSEFMEGNFGFTSQLLDTLEKAGNFCPIMLASSTQAVLDNPYGLSKKAGEDLIFDYSKRTGATVMVYRFPNVFGKWCRPNYNSAVATFCHNIAHNLPINVHDRGVSMTLTYIDDVVSELISAINGRPNKEGQFCKVPIEHKVELGVIVDLLYSFKESRNNLQVPNLSNTFTKKLYSTYLSYLPEKQFSYPLKMNVDYRGSFTEFLKSPDRGQVSINISKPGITKGEHWHHSKNEKFLVVSGKGVIRFRRIYDMKVIEYFVSGDKLEVVDIPVGYTHNIENLGDSEMVTIMWVNEELDPKRPDTYRLSVDNQMRGKD